MGFYFSDLNFTADDLASQGSQRLVYTHPHYSDFIFKKQKPLADLSLKNDFKGWTTRRFPGVLNRVVDKEYRAYVTACLGAATDIENLPISKMFGFAQSNIGIVQIAEKVSLDGKTIGPTVMQLLQSGGLTIKRLALLNDFVDLLVRSDIPMHDVTAHNIVLGQQRRGQEMFICVDGVGDVHAIPVRTYFRRVRRDALAHSLTKTARSLDLSFDRQSFSFAPL